MGKLRQIGKTGVLVNPNSNIKNDKALQEAMKIILEKLKAKKEKKNGKKMTIG